MAYREVVTVYRVDAESGLLTLREVKEKIREVTDEADKAGQRGERSFHGMGRALQGMAGVGAMALITLDRIEIAQLAVENAQARQRLAQERLTHVVERYGAASREAARAQEELDISTRSVEIAQQRATIRLAFMIGLQIPQFINAMRQLAGATRTAASATRAFTAAHLGARAATLIGIGAAVAGAAAAIAVERMYLQQSPETNVNVYGDMNVRAETPDQLVGAAEDQSRARP